MAKKNHEYRKSTRSEDVDICILEKKLEDGNFSLDLFAVYSESFVKEHPDFDVSVSSEIDFIIPKRFPKIKKEEISKIINNFSGIAAGIYEEKKFRDIAANLTESQMEAAFNFLLDTNDPIVHTWTKSPHKRMTYFYRNVLPFLKKFENPNIHFFEFDKNELINRLKDLALSLAKNDNNDEKKALEHAYSHMNESALIYERMLQINHNLPIINLFVKNNKKSKSQDEQQKFLREPVRLKFAQLLEKDLISHPREVLCATMMRNGARTAEAAAINPYKFNFYNEFVAFLVDAQEDNMIRVKLKTPYSNRLVPLDSYSKHIVEMCCNILKNDASISEDSCLISAKELSVYIKNKLIEAGAKDIIESIEEEFRVFGGIYKFDDANTPEAYILRRDCATIWQFIDGLDEETVNRFLGHAPLDGVMRKSFNSEDFLREVAKKLDRHVIDPVYAIFNPACYPVEAGKKASFKNEKKVIIENNSLTPISIKISAQSSQPNSPLQIKSEEAINFQNRIYNSDRIDWSNERRVLVYAEKESR